jgi:hypothetical protein
MTQVSEITEQEYTSPELPKQSRLGLGLTAARLLLRNPGALKKLMVMGPDEERYVRPPREYKLPEYREGMKYCTSNEKYLRPTRWCNPREPEVIALANELGAYERSDWEFADAAYWWVKTKIASEMVPMDGVSATLKRGTGTCLHLTSTWIALCRAAGIKARYKSFKTMLNDVVIGLDVAEMMDLEESEQAMIPEMFNAGTPHPQGEACIDGEWVVAEVGVRPEFHAQTGVPIPKLGEDAIDFTFNLIPGTIEHFESLSLMFGISLRVYSLLAPVVVERSSIVLSAPLGRKIIEEAGGIEAYDQKARRRRGKLFVTEEITEEITRLTKDAERKQVVVFEE